MPGGTAGSSGTSRALVLNVTFEPLGVVSSRRAMLLVLNTKAELVHATERIFRSAWTEIPEPSVVRLARYVRVPRERTVAVNRRTVFARDGQHCQYCGAAAESIDHVVPRSRGGTHTWDNVVAACRQCNTHKEDRYLHEVGFELRHPPAAPRHQVWLMAMCGGARDDWVPYLGAGYQSAEPLTA